MFAQGGPRREPPVVGYSGSIVRALKLLGRVKRGAVQIGENYRDLLRMFHGLKLTFGTSEKIKDGSLDFVFLDDFHSDTGADIEYWQDKVIPGGIIAGRGYEEAREAVDEFAARRRLEIAVEPFDIWWTVRHWK